MKMKVTRSFHIFHSALLLLSNFHTPTSKMPNSCVILGYRREVDEKCALLDCYAASDGNFLPTLRDNLTVPSSEVKNAKDGADGLSRSVGKKLALLTVQ